MWLRLVFYLMRGVTVTQNRTIQDPARGPIALVSDPIIPKNDPSCLPRSRVGHIPSVAHFSLSGFSRACYEPYYLFMSLFLYKLWISSGIAVLNLGCGVNCEIQNEFSDI